MTRSCVGCKYLFQEGEGYSNYTWESDSVQCALDRNPNLPAERPYDWFFDPKVEPNDGKRSPERDRWPVTNSSRCERYTEGPYVELDVDGDDGPADFTNDEEVIKLICEKTGRQRHSRY